MNKMSLKKLRSKFARSEQTPEAKMFSKFGHDCTLTDVAEKYQLKAETAAHGWFGKISLCIFNLIVVSHESKFCTHHLRSFGALAKERNRQLTYYKYKIHPFSKARVYWAMIMICVMFYQLVATPFRYLMYDYDKPYDFGRTFHWIDFSVNLFHYFNILIEFRTGYYDEPMQEVVFNTRKIIKKYLKGKFLLDLASAIPVHWELYDVNYSYIASLLFLSSLKLLMIFNFDNQATLLADFYDIPYYNFLTAITILYNLLFWHVWSCMLRFLLFYIRYWTDRPSPLYAEETTHLYRFPLVPDLTMLDKYADGLDTATSLLYHAGYGKLPCDESELVLIICMWYYATIFFVQILALIMEINTGRTSSAYKYNEMEAQLMEYLKHKQLPAPVRSKILTYYEFKYQRRFFKEDEILATISEQLRQEMNLHACRRLVENVIFFRNLPLNLLVRIISCLKIEIYLVNDIIIRANTPGSSMYFISTGTVAIYTKSGKEVCHLEDGSHFGEIALLIKDTYRIASVIAVEVSEIYRLDQKDFVRAINPYPDLLANIMHIAEERMEVSSMLDEYNKRQQAS